MAQPTEVYVRPLDNDTNGDGSSGDPYGDLEDGIKKTTFDTTNGTRMNIMAGTVETVGAELSVAMADTVTTVAWVPSERAPCIFQGMTLDGTAGDGGIGDLSAGGSNVSIYSDTGFDYVHFIDLHCHSTGSNDVLELDDQCSVIRCEIDNATGLGIIMGLQAVVLSNYVHNIGGLYGIKVSSGYVGFNYLDSLETNNFSTSAIWHSASNHTDIERNIIVVDGATQGIIINQYGFARHNSIYAAGAATGQGIVVTATNKAIRGINNNLIEGFSGVGGVGIKLDSSNTAIMVYGGNAVYDCATNYIAPNDYVLYELGGSSSNESLSASPFTNASAGDFSPVDTGSVKEGSLPADFGNPAQ